jgi:hypothetical protein
VQIHSWPCFVSVHLLCIHATCVPSTLCSGSGPACEDSNECCSLMTCGAVNQGIPMFCGYFAFHSYVFWESCPRSADPVLYVSRLDSFVGDVSLGCLTRYKLVSLFFLLTVFKLHNRQPFEAWFDRPARGSIHSAPKACRSVHAVHQIGSSDSHSRHAGRYCNQSCL